MGDKGSDREQHVHFSGSSGAGYNNILIQPQRHGILDVHLGFLQLNHRYNVEFSVPWNSCERAVNEHHTAPPASVDSEDLNCQVTDCVVDKDGLKLKLNLFADKEHFLKEEVSLKCCKEGAPMKIVLNARILGEGQGTPMLRNGVRNIRTDHHKNRDSD